MAFNEDSRVKIPTILHLCRLGYTYLSLNKAKWDKSNNIFPDIFRDSITSLTDILSPIFRKQNLTELENHKLTELRDWLLPMLMNGQIKIKDAEGELAMAAEPIIRYNKEKI